MVRSSPSRVQASSKRFSLFAVKEVEVVDVEGDGARAPPCAGEVFFITTPLSHTSFFPLLMQVNFFPE
ncbi:MAG: hypothetical protein EBY87_05030 [Actinobacteria bacterium]|nr:hypothetical protein [Actinomycetota bacterium]